MSAPRPSTTAACGATAEREGDVKLIDLIRAPAPSSSDLRQALLTTCELDALAELDALKAKRRDVLLGGSDAALAKIDMQIAAAQVEYDRRVVAREEVERRLAEASAREEREALTARRSEVDREADAVAALLRSRYVKATNELVSIIERLLAAEQAVLEVNAALAAAGREDERLPEVEPRGLPWSGYFSLTHSIINRVTLPPLAAVGLRGWNSRDV